jgi:hypothetical protein
MTDRRAFLGTLLAAPAIVRAASLMPIWVPPPPVFWFSTGGRALMPTDTLHFEGLAFLALAPVIVGNTLEVAQAVRSRHLQPIPERYAVAPGSIVRRYRA